jgi:hypothetical protein
MVDEVAIGSLPDMYLRIIDHVLGKELIKQTDDYLLLTRTSVLQ